MKYALLPPLLLIILLSACQSYYPATRDTNLLEPILPVLPHDRDVEVFFPGEKGPSRPYRKIAILEQNGGPASSRVSILKDQAREYGADALIVVGSGSRQVVQSDDTFLDDVLEIAILEEQQDDFYISNVPYFQALAIVYEENIHPEYFNQFAEVFVYDESKGSYPAEGIKAVEYNFEGSVIREFSDKENEIAEEEYLYPERFFIPYLLNATEDWKETSQTEYGANTTMKRKEVDAANTWKRQVQITFDQNDTPVKISLQERNLYGGQGYESFQLYPAYDENGFPEVVAIHKLKRDIIKERYKDNYTFENGRIAEREILKVDEGGDEMPWIKIIYKAFPADYLADQPDKQ